MFTGLIDVHALRAMLGDPGVAVLDCRFDLVQSGAGRLAWLAGHVPGARYADLDRDLAAPVGPGTGRHPLPERTAFAARLASWGIGSDSQIIAYDDSGGAYAARAWWMVRWLGSTRVAVLDGGFKAWVAAGYPLESGGAGEAPTACPKFDTRAGEEALGSAEVAAALRDPGRLLVDARAPERFAGDVEPLDAVAGHVPGAVNHPFGWNLGADGRFKAPAELRRLWLERLAGRPPAAMIAMCGSGVTACHNLLALEVAGLGGGRLYAGSWSEWIRDPARPVGRGAA
jgi:thiosulfate/3-mercaptopyruvate sulfurtransferase